MNEGKMKKIIYKRKEKGINVREISGLKSQRKRIRQRKENRMMQVEKL